MNALDPEPERKGRLGRMLMSIGVLVGIGGGVVFAADQVTPSKRLFSDIVKIAIVEQPEPKKAEPPPTPPPPPPPPPKVKTQSKAKPQPAATQVPQPIKPTDTPPPDPVGLDEASFGSGSGGPAFAMGTTQMGTPGEAARAGAPEEPPKPKPKLVEARPKPGNRHPGYTDRARRLAIEGLMVIEADIDERGRVTRAVVRGKLEPLLDEATRRTVLDWRFDPATLDGKAVPSTKWLRIRFDLT